MASFTSRMKLSWKRLWRKAPAAAAPAPRAPASRSLEMFQPQVGISPRVKLDPKAREQSLQRVEEATQAMESRAAVQPAPVKKTRSLQPRSLESAPVEEQMAARKLARRSLVTRDAIVAQRDANAVMLDTLAKYKMNAEVTLSREGQMVIQVAGRRADPVHPGRREGSVAELPGYR